MVVCFWKIVDRLQGRICNKVLRISRNAAKEVAAHAVSQGKV